MATVDLLLGRVSARDGLYGSACIDSATHEIIIKLVNTSPYPKDLIIHLAGVRRLPETAKYTALTAATPEAVNSLENPMAVSPIESTIHCEGKILTQNIGANAFCVIRIKI